MPPPIAASEAQADGSPNGEDIPRIHPPSTGEQVAAARPNTAVTAPEPAIEQPTESTGVEGSLDSGIRSISEGIPDPYQGIEAEHPAPAAEPVDHHG